MSWEWGPWWGWVAPIALIALLVLGIAWCNLTMAGNSLREGLRWWWEDRADYRAAYKAERRHNRYQRRIRRRFKENV